MKPFPFTMPAETPGYRAETPAESKNTASSNLNTMLESLNTGVLKPFLEMAQSIMVAISAGSSGLLQPIIDTLEKITAPFSAPQKAETSDKPTKSIMEVAKERLKDVKTLMAFRSPEGSKGCANFVSFALGLHKYEGNTLVKNKEVLGNENINTNWVPDLVKLFRNRQYKEVTNPVEIRAAVQKGLPEGGIVIFANSYTTEDEDHIGVAVKNNKGESVVLNNGGPGVVKVRNDLMRASDPEKVRKRQEALKKNPKGGIARDPIVSKIFLPPEAA